MKYFLYFYFLFLFNFSEAKLTHNKKILAQKLFNNSYFVKYSQTCNLVFLKNDFKKYGLSETEGYEFLRRLRKNKKRAVDLLDKSQKSALSYAIETYMREPNKRKNCETFISVLVGEVKTNIKKNLHDLLTKANLEEGLKKNIKIDLAELLLQKTFDNPYLQIQRENWALSIKPKSSHSEAQGFSNKNPTENKNTKRTMEEKKALLTKSQKSLLRHKFENLSIDDILKKYKLTLDLGVKILDNLTYEQTNIDFKGKIHLFFDNYAVTLRGSYFQLDREEKDKYSKETLDVIISRPRFIKDNLTLVTGVKYKDNTGRNGNSIELSSAVQTLIENTFGIEDLYTLGSLGPSYNIGKKNKRALQMIATLEFEYPLKTWKVDLFAKRKRSFLSNTKENRKYEIGASKKITKNISLKLVHEDEYDKVNNEVVDDKETTSLKVVIDF